MGAKPWYDWVFRWRRAWDSNPRTVFGRQTISSRSRYDLFDSPPYISTVFRALRKCKKNTQEQYEILKFDPAKTLINQGFSAEKTARANAHFESFPPCDFWWKLSEDGSTQRKPKSCGILRILASVFRFYLNPQGFPSSSHFCPELWPEDRTRIELDARLGVFTPIPFHENANHHFD